MASDNEIIAMAKRYDGQMKYRWSLTFIEDKSDCLVLGGSSGRTVQYKNKKSITVSQPQRATE